MRNIIERAIWQSFHVQKFDVVGQFSVTDLVTDILAAMGDAAIRKDAGLTPDATCRQPECRKTSPTNPSEMLDNSAESILKLFFDADRLFEHGDDVAHMLKYGEAVDKMRNYFRGKVSVPVRESSKDSTDGSLNG